MRIILSERVLALQESATERMASLVRQRLQKGEKIANFTIGEPHFPVAEAIRRAADSALREGRNGYPPVPGIDALRQRVARKLRDENGLTYPADQVVITCGAKQAIFNFLLSVTCPGDEVLIPAPYWTSYPEMVRIVGGKPVIIPTDEATGFRLSPAELRRRITPRTKVLILNSPCNPTGVVYRPDELNAIASALDGTDVLVCSDEVYEKLTFSPGYTSFAGVSQSAFQRTVTINGFSKAFAMTGWRLGYAAGPKPILDAMRILQGQSTSGANSIAQYAALAALDLPADYWTPIRHELQGLRDDLVKALQAAPRLQFAPTGGAFYLWVNVAGYLGTQDEKGNQIRDSLALSGYVLQNAAVGVVPGSGFGLDTHVRFSFATKREEILQGGSRLARALALLQPIGRAQ